MVPTGAAKSRPGGALSRCNPPTPSTGSTSPSTTPHAIANAGLLLPATPAERLGIEQAGDQLIDMGNRPNAAHPGRKLLTLVHSMIAGW
jgi:hypothetical protein